MKRLASLVAISVFMAGNAFADPQPPVTLRQALEIGEKSLAERGLDKELWIEAVSLEQGAMLGGKQYWYVKWNRSIPASNPRNKEVGVKVYMDGRAVRLVKEPGV